MIKNPSADAGDIKDVGSIPGSGRFPEEGMAIQSSILTSTIYEQRTLAGYSPWGLQSHTWLEQIKIAKMSVLEKHLWQPHQRVCWITSFCSYGSTNPPVILFPVLQESDLHILHWCAAVTSSLVRSHQWEAPARGWWDGGLEERSDGQFLAFQLSPSGSPLVNCISVAKAMVPAVWLSSHVLLFLPFLSFSYIYLFIIYLHQARLRHFNF